MARLLITSGDAPPREYALTHDAIRIGRVAVNDLVLDDDAVSRIHACILRQGGQWVLVDAGSSSGTFVNGDRASGEVPLRDGDRIRAGRTVLQFEVGTPAAEPSSPPPVDPAATCLVADEGRVDEKTVAFRVSSAARPVASSLPPRHVAILAHVAKAVRELGGLEDLLEALLDAIEGHFHADRSAVLLCEAGDATLSARALRPREGGFAVSRSILDYAIRRQETVLIVDTTRDERFQDRPSITQESIRAAICAPLVRRDRAFGAIYIDFRGEARLEKSDDVVLLNLIAANAAIAIENAVLTRERDAAMRLGEGEPGPTVADSAAMKRVWDDIGRLAEGRGPILVVGDAGVGKLFAAKTIHKSSRGPEAPFVHADAGDLGARACEVIFGALDAEGEAEPKSLLRRSTGGTLALGHLEDLPRAALETLDSVLDAQAKGDLLVPDVRLILMTPEDPSRLAKEGRLPAPLLSRLEGRTLRMPRLRERREDILPLARLFLARRDREAGHVVHSLAPSAERLLASLPYRHGNAAELREAIEHATDIADGATIGAEHIFTGPKERGKRPEVDLTGVPPVPWLLRPRVLGVIRAVGAIGFLGLAAVCLVDGAGVAGRVANGLTWGVWWPALIALILLAGRVWCAVCPLATAGGWLRCGSRPERPPLDWLRRNTGWLVATLFVGIIWAEHVSHMPWTPRATGALLVTLVALCGAVSLTMSRQSWCRYACPLGALGAGFAAAAPLRVHAHSTVCGSMCKTHECVKGKGTETGCPMFLHPLYARDAQFCKLCLACVRNCPNGSARFWLGPPLADLWRSEEMGPTLAPFCLVLFLLAPWMLATHGPESWASDDVGFTIAAAAALVAGLAAGRVLPRLLGAEGDTGARVSHALLVAAWGPLAAFHLALVPGLSEVRIGAPAGFVLGTFSFPVQGVLQLGCIAFAAVLSHIALRKIRARNGGRGWLVVRATWALHVVTSFALAWRAGAM